MTYTIRCFIPGYPNKDETTEVSHYTKEQALAYVAEMMKLHKSIVIDICSEEV